MTTLTSPERPRSSGDPKPVLDGQCAQGESAVVYVFVILPMFALLAAVPLGWLLGTTPTAIMSMGESWRNRHHADPTYARHGVRRGQIDMSARLIRLLEMAGR